MEAASAASAGLPNIVPLLADDGVCGDDDGVRSDYTGYGAGFGHGRFECIVGRNGRCGHRLLQRTGDDW